MQKYLNQLIEDMHLAAQRVPQSTIPEDTFEPDYMMELEDMEEQPMSDWFGLEKMLFPSSEMLTAEQLELMAYEFEKLWGSFNFDPYFPEGLPAKRRYELMRDYLDHKCTHWPGGWVHTFEFCNYDPDNCPFGQEYCRCKEMDYNESVDLDIPNSLEEDLPF